jgi:2-alkenal reductase
MMGMRNRWVLASALFVAPLFLMGCGLLSPAARLLSGERPAEPQQVIEQIVVATPEGGAAELLPAPTLQPNVTIRVPGGADTETEIFRAVYEKVNPSVVYIEHLAAIGTGDESEGVVPDSQGSGFVWDAEGHVVTNHHVVEGADALRVVFYDGIELPAELVGSDPDSDLAVIKIDPTMVAAQSVEQGRIQDVQVGQRAIAIGNPFGLAGTMTTGIISAIGRSVASQTGYSIPLAIQTDAAINPGNSGGPLLNEQGEVIGINFQIRAEERANSGVGFAIPINIAQRVVPALIRNGEYEHAWLGVSGQTFSPAWAEALGFQKGQRGAYVLGVIRNGPAARAGLAPGTERSDILLGPGRDGGIYLPKGGDLIVAIDGRPVKTFDDILVYLESERSPADKVTLTVRRAGEGDRQLELTLGVRPSRTP